MGAGCCTLVRTTGLKQQMDWRRKWKEHLVKRAWRGAGTVIKKARGAKCGYFGKPMNHLTQKCNRTQGTYRHKLHKLSNIFHAGYNFHSYCTLLVLVMVKHKQLYSRDFRDFLPSNDTLEKTVLLLFSLVGHCAHLQSWSSWCRLTEGNACGSSQFI